MIWVPHIVTAIHSKDMMVLRVKGWWDKEEIHFYHPEIKVLQLATVSSLLYKFCMCVSYLRNSIYHPILSVSDRENNCIIYVFLTMTLRLGSQPCPIGQTGSLWWTLQHISRLTAKADNTAHCKLFAQTDTMHRDTWISTQPGGIPWKDLKREKCDKRSGKNESWVIFDNIGLLF